MNKALLLALLAACGGGQKTEKSPGGTGGGTTTAPAAADAVFGAGPPLVTVGERIQYRLALKGIELAVFELGVGDISEIAGKQAILVQSHVQASGLAGMVSAVNDSFSSYIDIATGRSLRFQVDEASTSNKQDTEHTVIDIAGRQGNAVPIAYSVNDGASTPESQAVSGADLWDFNSFLIALRSWEPAKGAELTVEAMRSRWMWKLTTKAVGKEKIVTELGELPALVFETHCTKLTRTGERQPNNSDRDFTIYVSDDADRVPLLVTAATDYGAVKLEIVDYQAGSGQHLRSE